MSRKVYLTIQTVTMVPVVGTLKAIVTVDEGVDIDTIARRVVAGNVPSSATLEDSGYENFVIQDLAGVDSDTSFEDQLQDYVTRDDVTSRMIDFTIDDSK